MSSVVKLLRDLITLPSVNPAFMVGNPEWTGEQRVAEHLTALARAAGLDVQQQAVVPGRSNVVIRLKPKQRRTHRVVLAPHLDTVGVEDCRQFEPRMRGGRISGRGSCDTKGSVAAMLGAVIHLASRGPIPCHTEIVFAGLIDEENHQLGSRFFSKKREPVSLAVVGEPTRLQVITAHKGDLWLELETRGRAAHGSTPELGRNAVLEMSRVIQVLEGPYARAIHAKRHRLLGTATINVGTVRGGVQPNIVPDRCEITVDRRTLPGERDARVMQEMNRFLRRHGCQVSMRDWKGLSARPMETDPRLPLVQDLMRLRGQRSPLGVRYFSDAGVLSECGIPCVLFGPGDISQAHTVDEWISVPQLELAERVLIRFLEQLP